VVDQSGATDTQNLTITVHGKDDTAIISGADIGMVREDTTLQATGTLSVSDKDAGQDHFQAGDIQGVHGTLHLQANGTWTYDLDNQSRDVQLLGAGSSPINNTLTDVIQIHSADGTAHSISVTITGINDAPVLSVITAQSAREGDSTKTTGVLTGSDIDTNDQLTFSAPNVDGFVLKQDGSYSFDPSHGSYNHLAQGDVQTITIPVTVTDLAGATDTKNLVITLTGTNDAPVLQQIQAQSVTEDGQLLTGQLTATDTDDHEVTRYSVMQQVDGFTLHADGSYSFDPSHASYQHLAAGQVQTLTIPVGVVDQSGATDTQNLTITVHGKDDTAIISGADIGMVREDTTLQATGTLSVSDKDAGQDHFQAGDIQGVHGTLHLQTNGTWTYDLDNQSRDVQLLGAGSSPINNTLTDVIQIHSADGTAHSISVTITGINDAPVLSVITAQSA
ncbi:VCBS domain-containing protein, partial [Oleiphilus sp. HI0125]|uniref:VCBS domain-containing protein n=2 Tax=Oleiphilus sp. HI0125 TaxID=1822266 RepID=UPI000ADA656C